MASRSPSGNKITEYKKPPRKSSTSAKKKDTGTAAGKKTDTKAVKNRNNAADPEKKARKLSFPAALVLGSVAALFLELSNFNVFGTVGGWIKYAQFGLFGLMAYLFPVFVLLIFIASSYEEKKGRTIISEVLILLLLSAFAHLLSPVSLNNHNILSYFTYGAERFNGGGLLGGMIALGLFLLLSKTGAIIIVIMLIIICLFFLFEDQIRQLFSYIFYRDEEEEDQYAADTVTKNTKKSSSVQKRSARETEAEPLRSSRNSSRQNRSRQSKRRVYDEPVYVTEDEEGTVIRIVRSYKKHGRLHHTQQVRSNKKSKPMREGSSLPSRNTVKARGISSEINLIPRETEGDEVHEITRSRSGSRSGNSRSPSSDRMFDGTRISARNGQIEWDSSDPVFVHDEDVDIIPAGKDEAVVTSVSQAAVNRRKKAAVPVKSRKGDTGETTLKQQSAAARSASVRRMSNVASVRKFQDPEPMTYNPPPMSLLSRVKDKNRSSMAELRKIADDLVLILDQFGVTVKVTDIQAGPSVTRFELQPELGTRVNRITSLADDLKLNLGVTEIRIEAPIPGRQAVGIEIPNKNRQTVYMRELLEEPALINHSSKIAYAAGKDISGNVIVSDIAKMPHLLVAGTTGSGKSVFLNTILMTILYRAAPSEVGLIIVDPKKVEFGIYAGIPHLMKDVVTDPGQAVSTLRWAVNEMTNRYQRMQMSNVRDFKSYNKKVEKGTVSPEEENPRKMNQIVIIIDELADLMMVAKKEAESLICRLAQLARAAGIHLIIATQRPSVDVVTGLIKANVPARVALLVSSQIDSRTIIDMPGAEKLLGYGDMLFYPTGYVKPVRVQGAFVSDDEIQRTVDYLIEHNSNDYFAAESQEIEKFMTSQPDEDIQDGSSQDQASKYDECFYEAGKMCIEMGKASSSMLQRRFNLGFNRAARIIDQLEEFGAVGAQNGAKPREILVNTQQFEEMYQNMMNNR